MDHTTVVRVLQCLGHRSRYLHRLINGQLLLAVDSLPERFPLHMRHDIEQEAVRLAGVEQRQDVRVLQVGRGLDLSEEAFGPYYSSQLGLQDLERDLSLVLEVVGEVDRGHPALTKFTLDAVAALEGCVQARDSVGGVHSPNMRLRPAECE